MTGRWEKREHILQANPSWKKKQKKKIQEYTCNVLLVHLEGLERAITDRWIEEKNNSQLFTKDEEIKEGKLWNMSWIHTVKSTYNTERKSHVLLVL